MTKKIIISMVSVILIIIVCRIIVNNINDEINYNEIISKDKIENTNKEQEELVRRPYDGELDIDIDKGQEEMMVEASNVLEEVEENFFE